MKQTTQPGTTAKIITVLILLSVPTFIGYKIFGSADEDKVTAKKNTASDALAGSYQFVEDQLKSPSTAEFGYYEADAVKQIDDSTFAVHNYVDSQNSFGATLRANYSCTIVFTHDDKIRCLDLKIDQ